jgi:phosphohistidine swiveling domain-containing protein
VSLTPGSKANTLKGLSDVLVHAKVLPIAVYTVREWRSDPDGVIQGACEALPADAPLIVRSSSMREDGAECSNAGRFSSVLNVTNERNAILGAIEQVLESYGSEIDESDQFFLQPMLADVEISGVAFTRDPNTGADYFVVNYDQTSGSTDSVTSGRASQLETWFYHHSSPVPAPSAALARVIDLCLELHALFGGIPLDIEFGVRAGQVYLFQVRRLSVIRDTVDHAVESHGATLARLEAKIRTGQGRHPYLLGRRTVYGVMPDWNPAEIVGIRPRPLAFSLYRELITDNIWAYQRDNYGYRSLRSFPLLQSFEGLPYVDVRVSFNSFVPKDVPHGLAERLVDYYIDRLVEHPEQHDKVEFDIIYTCYTFDIEERLGALGDAGFSVADRSALSSSLRQLTRRVIGAKTGLWVQDAERIDQLESRFDAVVSSDLDTISKIFWLVEDCKRFGTLPFAGLARAGFIAVQLLQSLRAVGVLSPSDFDAFLASLRTVSGDLARHFHSLPKVEFLRKYGHLRPGTYDIMSYRYDEKPDLYFDWSRRASGATEHGVTDFRLSLKQLRTIGSLLEEHGFDGDVLGLFDFCRAAIEGREYSKFVFTQSLSAILQLVEQLGEGCGLDRNDCSYIDIADVLRCYSASSSLSEVLVRSSAIGKERHARTTRLALPPLIVEPEQVWSFHLPASAPNYVTRGQAVGHTMDASDRSKPLDGAIVFIPSADPGYDWLFAHPIAGFVTMFGGVNSHMAIRAAELGLPAVVGAGQTLYDTWRKASIVRIDCEARKVEVLR